MRFKWSPALGELKGASVFLSASVPSQDRNPVYLDGPADLTTMLKVLDERIDAAVQSLVARVLGAGGRIVHGGHPKLFRPLSKQASQWQVDPGDEPILIYQSEHFRESEPPDGREELEASGVARITWVPTDWEKVGQQFEVPLDLLEALLPAQGPPQMPEQVKGALLAMRVQMLMETRPKSAVCIGGMEGIEAEAELFRTLVKRGLLPPGGALNVVKGTYGAAAKLGGEELRIIDSPPVGAAAIAAAEAASGPENFGVACDSYMNDFVAGLGKGQ